MIRVRRSILKPGNTTDKNHGFRFYWARIGEFLGASKPEICEGGTPRETCRCAVISSSKFLY